MLVVWLLIGAVFVLFNSVYWPARSCQERSHPASFVAYAQDLFDKDQPEAARDILLGGIARLNPPAPEPHALLSQVYGILDDPAGAMHARHRADFYRALQHTPVDAASVVRAAEGAASAYASLQLDTPAGNMMRHAAASFGAAFDIHDALAALPVTVQIALLEMGGSRFSFDGRIGDTGVVAPAPMLVYSGGGMDARRNAHILVGGRDYADGQRGMHVVLLDAETAAVLQTGVFDLWESVEEARRMRQFLVDAPRGCIGLFAVRDDGSAFLTSGLEQALFDFGIDRLALVGRSPAILGLRYGFAAIGRKGAPPGTAMQSWSPEEFKGYRGHPVVCAVFHGKEQS